MGRDFRIERPPAPDGAGGRDLIAPLCQGALETTSAIGDHAPVDDLRELALEASQGLGGGLVLAELARVVIPSRPGCMSWTLAARCRALFSERLPLRARRWRVSSSLETATGAVPV